MKTEKRPPAPPPRTLAIDPGLRMMGAALFEGDRLVRASVIKSPSIHERDVTAWTAICDALKIDYPSADRVVMEMMVVRPGRRDVNADDLMQLVGIVGVIAGLYAPLPASVVRPSAWKGSVQKRIHHQRIIAALDPAEKAILDRYMSETSGDSVRCASSDVYIERCKICRKGEYPQDPIHNAIDAIGIGLHAVQRFSTGKKK